MVDLKIPAGLVSPAFVTDPPTTTAIYPNWDAKLFDLLLADSEVSVKEIAEFVCRSRKPGRFLTVPTLRKFRVEDAERAFEDLQADRPVRERIDFSRPAIIIAGAVRADLIASLTTAKLRGYWNTAIIESREGPNRFDPLVELCREVLGEPDLHPTRPGRAHFTSTGRLRIIAGMHCSVLSSERKVSTLFERYPELRRP